MCTTVCQDDNFYSLFGRMDAILKRAANRHLYYVADQLTIKHTHERVLVAFQDSLYARINALSMYMGNVEEFVTCFTIDYFIISHW